jgi:hypothetical protein
MNRLGEWRLSPAYDAKNLQNVKGHFEEDDRTIKIGHLPPGNFLIAKNDQEKGNYAIIK